MANPPPSGGNRQQWAQDTGVPQQPYNPYDYTHDQGDTAATHHPQTNRPMPELQQQEGGPYETGDNMANAASVGGQFAEGGYSAMPSAFDPAGGAHNLIPQVGQAVGQGQQLHALHQAPHAQAPIPGGSASQTEAYTDPHDPSQVGAMAQHGAYDPTNPHYGDTTQYGGGQAGTGHVAPAPARARYNRTTQQMTLPTGEVVPTRASRNPMNRERSYIHPRTGKKTRFNPRDFGG